MPDVKANAICIWYTFNIVPDWLNLNFHTNLSSTSRDFNNVQCSMFALTTYTVFWTHNSAEGSVLNESDTNTPRRHPLLGPHWESNLWVPAVLHSSTTTHNHTPNKRYAACHSDSPGHIHSNTKHVKIDGCIVGVHGYITTQRRRNEGRTEASCTWLRQNVIEIIPHIWLACFHVI